MSPNVPSSEFRVPSLPKARYLMIGGFLGAGKTTSVVRLAERLTKQGLRVGLITNDQGSELVDTAMLRSRGFATEEIPGGCFCCRFNSLVRRFLRCPRGQAPAWARGLTASLPPNRLPARRWKWITNFTPWAKRCSAG